MSWNGNARLNAKRDANERPIIETLEARGFVVKQLNGKGCPDLLVARRGSMWLAEIKREKGTFTVAQVKWLRDWTGPTPIVLRSVDDALTFPFPSLESAMSNPARVERSEEGKADGSATKTDSL